MAILVRLLRRCRDVPSIFVTSYTRPDLIISVSMRCLSGELVNPAHALHLAAVGFLLAATAFGQLKQVSTSTRPAFKTGTIKGRVVAADTHLGLEQGNHHSLAQERIVRIERSGGKDKRKWRV